MFHRPGCVALLLIAVGLLSATSHAQSLPAVALTEDVAAIARIDLKAIDLPAAKAAAASAAEVPDVTLAPLLVKLELIRRTLTGLGVDCVVFVIPAPKSEPEKPTETLAGTLEEFIERERQGGPPRRTVLLHVPGKHDGADPRRMALMVVEESIRNYQWTWQGEWLVVHDKRTELDPDAKPGQNAQRFEKGLDFLGNWPGLVIVPTPAVRTFVERGKADLRQAMPVSLTDSLEPLLAASWIAVAAKMGSDASLKIVAEMPDEARAKRLESALDRAQKNLATWAGPPADEDQPVPRGFQIIQQVKSWKLLRSNQQAGFLLDAKQFGQLVDTAHIQRIYFGLDYGIGKEHPWRSLVPLSMWIEIYRILYRKMPDTLDDLKPLLGRTQAEQDEHLKRLLTNTVTGEYPSVSYTQVPMPKPEDEDDPDMLFELKDGVHPPGGALICRSGRLHFSPRPIVPRPEQPE